MCKIQIYDNKNCIQLLRRVYLKYAQFHEEDEIEKPHPKETRQRDRLPMDRSMIMESPAITGYASLMPFASKKNCRRILKE